MSTIEGKARFITTLRTHLNVAIYEPNRDAKELAWTRSIGNTVNPYDDDSLDEAIEKILNSRTGKGSDDRRFPLPGEIRKVCDQIILDRKRPSMLDAEAEAQKSSPWSRGRSKFVVEHLLSGEMGKRAAREGWIGSLFDECRARNALPSENEVWKIKETSRKFQETRQMCHAGAGWPSTALGLSMGGACANLGDTIEKRNRLLASIVLGRSNVELLFTHLDYFADDEAAA